MDDLINEMGADSIGLNIVCEAAPSTSAKPKKKKNNRDEKRRAKGKRIREERANKKTQNVESKKVGTQNDSQQSNSRKEKVEKDQDLPSAPIEDISDLVARAMQTNQSMEEESAPITPPTPEPKSEEKETPPSEYSKEDNLWKQTSDMSRKTSHETTVQVLQDEAKRAQYLSTYHARPYEMDRKSGAVSHIQESKESTHIFGDDDLDIEHELNKFEGNDKATCPFTTCGVHDRLVKALKSNKFNLKRPTVIQRNAWTQMIPSKRQKASKERRNLFIQSETGSGKTLAFLIPLMQSLAVDTKTNQIKKVDRNLGGTRALILCPTRELATQTYAVAEKLCLSAFPWLVAGCLSGGEKRKSEKARLRKGITVLVATPGRLLDHLEKTECLLMALKGKVEWIVLDESDRLLDMGLGSQVEQIVQIVRANQSGSGLKRDGITWQSMLVSATITKQVEKLASKLLGGSKWVWAKATRNDGDDKLISENEDGANSTKDMELSNSAPQQLTQLHMVVSSKLRLAALVAFLAERVQKKERVIVFMSTCDGVDYHYKLFNQMTSLQTGDKDTDASKQQSGLFGEDCTFHRLHGNIPHRERHNIIESFSKVKKNQASVLVTTDVTARGLNLPAVDWIVQYDPPCETADYVHRAGRAARAGKSGHALLFLLPSETQYIEVLKLRGLKNITALSLSVTLQKAAKLYTDVTSEGLQQTGQGNKASESRMGEAFASAVQIRMEDAVVEDDRAYKEALAKKIQTNKEVSDKAQRKKERREAKNAIGPLLESARSAYNAYIRGYSTKEKAVRHIFSARALHLGHVARSFALKEQPKELSKAQRQARKEEADVLKSKGRKRNSALAFGKKKNSGNEVESDDMQNEGNVDARPIQAKSKKAKKQRSVVLDGIDFTPTFSAPEEEEKPVYKNVKEKMMAVASKMQSSGMEFF